ncbi:MAG TPA: methyltransferase domain-containing protein, partial [Polyangia bacterium]
PGVTPEAAARALAGARERSGGLAVVLGGEPFVRRDLFRLLEAVRRAGFAPGLVTNGRALAYDEARRRLRDAGLAYLRVQLFGWEATHDEVTGGPGSFRQALDGLAAFAGEDEAGVDLEIGLTLSPRTLPEARVIAARLAGRFPRPEVHLAFAVAGLDEAPGAGPALAAAVASLAEWNRRSFGPLLVWEGLPECLAPAPAHLRRPALRRTFAGCREAPPATCLGRRRWPPPLVTRSCGGCAARARCPGVPAAGFTPRAAGVPDGRAAANSFNFVHRRALPPAATAAACAADRACPDPDRALVLAGDAGLALYETDTADFSPADVRRVKRDLGHLFLDRSATAALDDFVDSVRRVTADPFCDPCDRRDGCGRRYRVDPEPPFRRDERWIAAWIGRLRGRVLDVGCGEQLYKDVLAPLVRAGTIEYHGLDPDAPSIEALRRAVPEGHYTVGPIETYHHRPRYFDHILALRSLNHLVDVGEAFARMVELLRPMGTLLIAECTPFALLRESRQVDYADRQPRAGHQHLRNWDSWDTLPLLRLLPLRTLYHRPITAQTNNQWVLHLLREDEPGGERGRDRAP